MTDGIKIMGIINATPDSFFGPSRYNMSILDEDIDIVDVGACSTRPGSEPVGEDEEWERLEPVISPILKRDNHPVISIDTFRSGIVRRVYDLAGPVMVNDVTAGSADPEMLPLVRELGLEYVAVHNEGRIAGSEVPSSPEPVLQRVMSFFKEFGKMAEGIDWILDPGFGFGKTYDENWELLAHLDSLKCFNRPILVGVSRKKMTMGTKDETIRAHKIAIERGASILRVHELPIL